MYTQMALHITCIGCPCCFIIVIRSREIIGQFAWSFKHVAFFIRPILNHVLKCGNNMDRQSELTLCIKVKYTFHTMYHLKVPTWTKTPRNCNICDTNITSQPNAAISKLMNLNKVIGHLWFYDIYIITWFSWYAATLKKISLMQISLLS